MIHLKKISVLIALAAVLCLIWGPATAAARTLAAGTASGDITTPASTVSIPITLDDPSGVGGIAFTLTYDPAVLQFDSLSQGAKVIANGDGTYSTDNLKNYLFYQVNDEGASTTRTGRVMVAAATAQALTGTNLVLLNAKFKILGGNGTYPIGVVKTIVQNASAGYTSPTQLPVLVGTTTPNGQGMYTSTDFPVYPATLVAGGITVNAPKFTISGSVIYQGGASATGSTVVLKRESGSAWVFDSQTTVSGTGTYTFGNKPAANYQVFVTSSDPNYANGQSASFAVSANKTVPEIILAAPQRLTGSVTLNGGYKAGLQVMVKNGNTVVGVYAVNPDGTFQTPPLPTGPTYTLWAVYGSYSAQITAGQPNALTTTLRSIGDSISGLTGAQTLTVTASSVNGKLQKTTTATTAAGAATYSIGDLVPATDYIVSVTGNGVPVTYYSNKTDITQATPVDISAANRTDVDFNFAGITKGTIGGTITESAAGAANVAVYAFETATFALTQVTANGSGVYSFTLPPGTYEIFVIKANNKIFYFKDGAVSTQSEAEATKLALISGGNLAGKNIDITECTSVLTGKVAFQRADGDPAANVLITATSSGGNGIAMTGANGVYSIGGLCGPFDYRVEMNPLDSRYAVQSATVAIGDGATVTQNFVIGAGNVLSGKITDSSNGTTPIGNAMIYLLDQQTGMLVNQRMYFSNATGDYTIADILNSVDTLNVNHPLYRAYRETDLTIRTDMTKNIQLVKGAYFNVTVQDGSAANAPLAGALVIVTRAGAVPVYALTDATGNCKIYGLDELPYTILAQKAQYERQSTTDTPSSLVGGKAISFTLSRPAALFNLSGTITSSCSGTPAVAGAYVLVSTVIGNSFASALTNASGQYSFTDLPQANDYGFVVVPGGALRTYVEPNPLNFTATTVKNVQIPCGGTITGTITNGTTPVAASVFLYTAGNVFVASTQANASGVYTFAGLASTTNYKVLAVATGINAKWYNGTTIGDAEAVSVPGTANINLAP